MKFNYITIKNVRSYKGETTFYLSPEEKERPILIYGGNNGAGKTSLLNAFSICLYGKLALGDRVSKREYQEFLSDYVYRFGSTFEKEGAEITLSFDFARNGKIQSYNVTREWKKKQKNIVENFTVQKNDQLLMNIDPDDWDDFIRDILPPRLIDLMFFDGEEIKSIAEQDNPGKGLSRFLRKCLGSLWWIG